VQASEEDYPFMYRQPALDLRSSKRDGLRMSREEYGESYLLRQYELADDEMLQELNAAFDQDVTKKWLPDQEQESKLTRSSRERSQRRREEVWVDVGYKSEGIIPASGVV